MKKILIVGILGLLFSGASLALADTIVQAPAILTLKVAEKATVTNYQNIQIELTNIGSINTMSYPIQTKKNVQVRVTMAGGCGPNADPRCLGGPSYENTFTITEGRSAVALALNIKVVSISSDNAKFSISVGGTEEVPPPCILRPACLDATPRCLMAEPAGGWCEHNVECVGSNCGTTVGGSGPVGFSGSGSSVVSGGIIICPNGVTGKNCSFCSEGGCSAQGTSPENKQGKPGRIEGVPPAGIPGVGGGISPTFALPQGQELISVEKIKSKVSTSTPTHYEVKTKKKSRLFYILPVSAEVTYSVNSKTGVGTVTNRPWWDFLVR